jgi:murein DD-endopeptidase MepM/ murein hydrolase activator NlpD
LNVASNVPAVRLLPAASEVFAQPMLRLVGTLAVGETGLAAGDHLHFGVYLDGVAVLPVEWWDQKWIGDNIKPKLEGRSGREIAEAQQPAKGARKGGGKRRR